MLNFKKDGLQWHTLFNEFCEKTPVEANNWFFFYLMDNDIKNIDESTLVANYAKFKQIDIDPKKDNPPDSWRGLP